MPKIIVVTPTYNERENIGTLVKQVFSLGIPDLGMVVVDDNSPDGTAELALELSKKYPIKVIRRDKKTGLGTAYIEAFKSIFRQTQDEPHYVVQMDADLSHDPKAIPAFLEKIKDHDLVLGSRYVAGGKIENWDYLRRLVSKFGNIYARAVLASPYRDLTGGLKCWRSDVLKGLDFNSLSSTGYNFQIETTYLAHKKGHKICEIPITFTERKFGSSKFNLPIMLEAFWKVLMLRFRR